MGLASDKDTYSTFVVVIVSRRIISFIVSLTCSWVTCCRMGVRRVFLLAEL